ncbi:MAG: BamA/TamA family outer membrane protein [Candidatus Chromulinivorax sp.]
MSLQKIILFLCITIFSIAYNVFAIQEGFIVVDCTYDVQELQKKLPAKLFVKSIDIKADFKVDQDELLYLIDIVPMSHILLSDLEQTLFYLRKKECFAKIELWYHPIEHTLIFVLDGVFVLSSLRLHGSMIGKEKYQSAYVIEPGEYFDEKKHLYSLKKMKEKFYQAGFFQAEIADKVVYDSIEKTVKVDLYLHKGSQFYIGDCKINCSNIKSIAEQDFFDIHQQIQHLVRRYFSLKYSKSLIDKIIRQLQQNFSKLGYSQVSITHEEKIDYEHKQVNISFMVSIEQKKEFVFWGNHFFSQQNFLENILMYGKSSWDFPASILADEIESMYKSKGFWDVVVTVKQEPEKTFFMIQEGKRAIIDSIEIKDNFYILAQIIDAECFKKIKDKPFDRDTFSQALTNLKQLYMQRGFWDIKIVKEEFVPVKSAVDHPKYKKYRIVLTLDEGILRKLKSIQIPHYPELLTKEPFNECLQGKDSVVFNFNWILQQKLFLIEHFKDLGFSKVSAEYTLVEEHDGYRLSWDVQVQEQQIYFGKFILAGNSQIPFKFIKREIDVQPGMVWDKNRIEKTVNRLRNLELFDTVYVHAHKEKDFKDDIPVGVKLIAADKYEVRTRIGGQQVGKDFSLQQGFSYKIGGTAIINNPFKFGDRFIVEADFTRFYENFSMQYVMPWLFATRPIRSQIKLYDNHYLQPLFIGSDVSIYNAFAQGILFGLQEKHEQITFGSSIGLEFKGIKTANIPDIAISIDYDEALFAQKFAFIFVEPSLLWTNVDNILNPRVGSNAFISFMAMLDITSQTSFFKLLGEYALYIPFTNKTIGAIRTRVGHVFNRQYNQILPIDRFYLGGANTVRGYDRDYCPPLGRLTTPVYAPNVGLPPAANDEWRYVNQGGRTMLNCNFELRFPIYYEFTGAIFADTGVLVKDSVEQVPDNILAGVGFGFRYNTPIGPIRFDLAFKFDRQYPDFQAPYVWYLTLGQAF